MFNLINRVFGISDEPTMKEIESWFDDAHHLRERPHHHEPVKTVKRRKKTSTKSKTTKPKPTTATPTPKPKAKKKRNRRRNKRSQATVTTRSKFLIISCNSLDPVVRVVA